MALIWVTIFEGQFEHYLRISLQFGCRLVAVLCQVFFLLVQCFEYRPEALMRHLFSESFMFLSEGVASFYQLYLEVLIFRAFFIFPSLIISREFLVIRSSVISRAFLVIIEEFLHINQNEVACCFVNAQECVRFLFNFVDVQSVGIFQKSRSKRRTLPPFGHRRSC